MREISARETGETLGHGSAPSTCAASLPRGRTLSKISGHWWNAEERL